MKLITGATGRIGYMLVKELFDRGERVKVLVRKGSNRDILKHFNCEYIEGDILNTTEWDNHLDDIDTVFHLAGNINISNRHKSSTMDTNVHGTQNIADLCLRNGINMVYTSSIHAIAAPKDGSLITESTPLCTETKERRGIYDYSKAYATEYLLNAIPKGLKVIIVHPTGVIGPHDHKPSFFGAGMIQLIKEGIKTTIGGSYDYVDVRDVVLGLLKALELKKFGERYILSGGLLKMGDYVSYLKEFTGIQADTKLLGYRTSLVIAFFSELFNKNSTITRYTVHTLHANTNISHRKATNDLGYSPRSVKESIKDQYEWFKLNGYLNEK